MTSQHVLGWPSLKIRSQEHVCHSTSPLHTHLYGTQSYGHVWIYVRTGIWYVLCGFKCVASCIQSRHLLCLRLQ